MQSRRRRPLVAAPIAAAVLLTLDLVRPPERQLSSKVLVAGIHLYRGVMSERLSHKGVRCRFTPTCSHYSEAVIRRDGAAAGLWRTVLRLGRCGPWTEAGTVDLP